VLDCQGGLLGCRDEVQDCQGGLLGCWDGARLSGWNARL
jgi:hypothetical protein